MGETATGDPLVEARAALDDAQRAETEAEARLEDLRKRRLGGDKDVTAEMYRDAAAAVDLAKVDVQGAVLQLQDAQRAARGEGLDDLRAEILAKTGTPERALKLWRDIAELCGELTALCKERQPNIPAWQRRLHQYGVAEGLTNTAPENRGLGWARAGMGWGDSVVVDGRRIQSLDPGMLIASAALAGALAHGIKFLRLDPNRAITGDPDRWFGNHY